MFSLKLLGGVLIEGPQGPLGGRVAQRRRIALLSVLALSRGRPVSRDKLLALFWPESDSERARHSLAESLYQIRRELGERAILSVGEELWLNADLLRSDVEEFENALERGELVAAAAAYTGPLLDGFHLSDAPGFEHWIDTERERLARAYGHALEQLAEEASARGDSKSAVEWWRRLATREPYNGRIILRLMETLASAGDRAAAFKHARIHAALLAEEFGAEPDAEVTALAERLRSGAATGSHHGRTAEVLNRSVLPDAGEDTSALALDAFRVERTPRAGTRRRLMGARAIGLVVTLILSVAAVRFVDRLLPGRGGTSGASAEAVATSPKAIAVLPCANLSADPEEEYFSDGLTEELIGALAQVRALRVAARTSVFAFKGTNRDIREIGRSLRVGTLLECSVRRAEDRVRVTAQLINAGDGFRLWSDTYEREGADIFAIQTDLALRIASALEAELTPAERERLAHRPTTNPEAYTLYLKGRYFWNQRTSGAYSRAIDYYERAITLDPQYAAAYAGLARTYALQGLSGYLTPHEAGERMRTAALEAVELDDALAEAHAELGAYLNLFASDSDAAEREYLRAIELDPSYPTARHLYGNLLRAMGRFEEALEQKRKAVELDPLVPAMHEALGNTLLLAGHPEEARAYVDDAIELDSMFWRGHTTLGFLFELTGQLEEAVRAHQRAVQLAGESTAATAGLARALALVGRKAESQELLAELQAEAARTGVNAPIVASVFLALDNLAEARAWLEKSHRQKHPELRLMSADDPRFARLQHDPRSADLLRRIRVQQ
jgi:TolB-like protein/DNA-binding SARP family transcriptional activator/Tfp pilus assembly protein PilF